MLPTAAHETSKEALNRRLESIGWGLFLIIIGALWLFPGGIVPEGTWLMAAGVIMLGVNVVRYLNDIKMSGASLLLGLLAVIFGVGAFVGMDLPFVAMLLIVFGLGIILRPWLNPLLAFLASVLAAAVADALDRHDQRSRGGPAAPPKKPRSRRGPPGSYRLKLPDLSGEG